MSDERAKPLTAMTPADYVAWAEALVADGLSPAKAGRLALDEATAAGDVTPDLNAALVKALSGPTREAAGRRSSAQPAGGARLGMTLRAMIGRAETIRVRWTRGGSPAPRATRANRTVARSPDGSA
jgi:hypothetical protein